MNITTSRVRRLLEESNMIEGITRSITDEDVEIAIQFLKREVITSGDVCSFVGYFQPDAKLRNAVGLDVWVGDHFPPRGGPEINDMLDVLLSRLYIRDADGKFPSPHDIHCQYERLHPFTDCNGRSGRIIWAWQLLHYTGDLPEVDFLHWWYYQSLSANHKRNN